MKTCYKYSLEVPQWGASNEYQGASNEYQRHNSCKIRKCTSRYRSPVDSNQPVHPHDLISFCCLHEETLQYWLSKMCPFKIQIRLHECAIWSESSLGTCWKVRFLMLGLIWFCGEIRKIFIWTLLLSAALIQIENTQSSLHSLIRATIFSQNSQISIARTLMACLYG